ncbi:HNH endonuclease [Nocardia camponoti]|uniref:HNH endonuclease n=1 Tax=Nocardia camponoti TaxID=1616106 RepID=A0A917V432_9NOCA|nr:HNH endonuclease [Nocardia camponoti]GGK33712.1 HNH endonuclease [Nocardia camponoti]
MPISAVAPTSDTWIRNRVLVLNASYEALDEIGADRAVTLLLSGTAETVVEHAPAFPIRSQHLTIALPDTIRLVRYVYLAHVAAIGDDSRATLPAILRRDRHRCGYCDSWAQTVDHIRPRSRGGPNTWNNLIACCAPCNAGKADRTPEEAGMRLLWEPKAPDPLARKQRRIWKEYAP